MAPVQFKPQTLLVEGGDEYYVLEALKRQIVTMPVFETVNCHGKDNVLNNLQIALKSDVVECLGLITDADDRPAERWADIARHLDIENEDGQPILDRSGSIFPDVHGIRFGAWLMPDNHNTGTFEHFMEQLIPANDPIWRPAQHFVAEIPAEHRKFNQINTKKAELRTWLAVRAEPGLLGNAVRSGDFDLSVDVLTTLLAWLNQLFG